MIDRILVRYGDLILKGKNKKTFIKTAIKRIEEKLDFPDIELEKHHARLYVVLNGNDPDEVINRLKKVPGLLGFSKVARTTKNQDAINQAALELAMRIEKNTSFKVETKRADKSYPKTSQEISQLVAAHVLKNTDHLTADVHNPEHILNVEVRGENSYLYIDKIEGLGGFPLGTMGKGICLLSGGIDSPVAAYLAMTKGIEVELMHFESTPLTSIESAQKAVDLAKKLAAYGIGNQIKLHLVPFTKLHETLLKLVPEPYIITIMRRMMVRIAEQKAEKTHIPVLINGESIGQVASQTLESIKVTDNAIKLPMLRPLDVMDKNDIVKIARDIDTYSISIRPFADCCTVYVPRQVTVSPRVFYAERYEKLFDMEKRVQETTDNIMTLTIDTKTNLDLTMHGLTVTEALKGAA